MGITLVISVENGLTVLSFVFSGRKFLKMQPTTAAEIACMSHGLDWAKVVKLAAYAINKDDGVMSLRIEIPSEKMFDILVESDK